MVKQNEEDLYFRLEDAASVAIEVVRTMCLSYTISNNVLFLNDYYYVPSFSKNIISVYYLFKDNYFVTFDQAKFLI